MLDYEDLKLSKRQQNIILRQYDLESNARIIYPVI